MKYKLKINTKKKKYINTNTTNRRQQSTAKSVKKLQWMCSKGLKKCNHKYEYNYK